MVPLNSAKSQISILLLEKNDENQFLYRYVFHTTPKILVFLTHVVEPINFIGRWIGPDSTLEIDITSFLDIFGA